ncbi:MAG: hypothetical protein ACLVD7_04065 [[Clostridium] leptum]
MAFTRRSLGALGLSEEQVDKVMALHGTSMSDFIPKSELQEKLTWRWQMLKKMLCKCEGQRNRRI